MLERLVHWRNRAVHGRLSVQEIADRLNEEGTVEIPNSQDKCWIHTLSVELNSAHCPIDFETHKDRAEHFGVTIQLDGCEPVSRWLVTTIFKVKTSNRRVLQERMKESLEIRERLAIRLRIACLVVVRN